MKLMLSILALLFFVSCASNEPVRVKLDTTERIQTIPGYFNYHIFVQKEHMIEQGSLEKGLATANPDWKEPIEEAQNARKYSTWFQVLQFGTLFPCIIAPEPTIGIAWCLTSIAMVFPARHFLDKYHTKMDKVVSEYNKEYPDEQTPKEFLIEPK